MFYFCLNEPRFLGEVGMQYLQSIAILHFHGAHRVQVSVIRPKS